VIEKARLKSRDGGIPGRQSHGLPPRRRNDRFGLRRRYSWVDVVSRPWVDAGIWTDQPRISGCGAEQSLPRKIAALPHSADSGHSRTEKASDFDHERGAKKVSARPKRQQH
jgi:hypothetical protein